jgi:hypothetical protein
MASAQALPFFRGYRLTIGKQYDKFVASLYAVQQVLIRFGCPVEDAYNIAFNNLHVPGVYLDFYTQRFNVHSLQGSHHIAESQDMLGRTFFYIIEQDPADLPAKPFPELVALPFTEPPETPFAVPAAPYMKLPNLPFEVLPAVPLAELPELPFTSSAVLPAALPAVPSAVLPAVPSAVLPAVPSAVLIVPFVEPDAKRQRVVPQMVSRVQPCAPYALLSPSGAALDVPRIVIPTAGIYINGSGIYSLVNHGSFPTDSLIKVLFIKSIPGVAVAGEIQEYTCTSLRNMINQIPVYLKCELQMGMTDIKASYIKGCITGHQGSVLQGCMMLKPAQPFEQPPPRIDCSVYYDPRFDDFETFLSKIDYSKTCVGEYTMRVSPGVYFKQNDDLKRQLLKKFNKEEFFHIEFLSLRIF